MFVWHIDIFENKDDKKPIRQGYVQAENENEALELAKNAMGDRWRADLSILATSTKMLPVGQVVWIDELNQE